MREQKILRREYELSIGCDRPHIVDLYEYRCNPTGENEILMEYVEGRTLEDFLSEDTSLKTKKRIFSELLDAVNYLHQRRIIHNDLKPSNILISRNGDRVKLIDLGLSDDDAHYELKTPGYSSGYAAPELQQVRKSDVRSDIYSLGLLMRLIFNGKYKRVVKKCLQRDPAARYKDVASLDKSWRYSMGRLKRLKIGGIFTGIGTIMIFLGFLIFQQKQRLENIKNTVAYQENELNKQKELYGTLNETYHHLKDSIKFEAGKARLHEEKKDKVITTFRRELKAISAKSLDSIKRTREARENFIIRQNYVNRANKLYNEMPKEIDGEDLGPILFPIMNNTITETFNEFNKYPVDIGMSDEE